MEPESFAVYGGNGDVSFVGGGVLDAPLFIEMLSFSVRAVEDAGPYEWIIAQ